MKPRVIAPETGDSIALEDIVQSRLDESAPGAIEIVGTRGAGKTTALVHLAASLVSTNKFVLLDEPEAVEVRARAEDALVVFTSQRHTRLTDTSFTLAAWSDDDSIEYLLAMHPVQCASVMRRLRDDPFRRPMRGEPQLWSAVLDELAGDESLPGIRQALRRNIAGLLSEPAACQAARQLCLALLLDRRTAAEQRHYELVSTGCEGVTKWTRHRAVQVLCAADAIQELIGTDRHQELAAGEYPHDLVQELGQMAAADEGLSERVRRMLKRTSDPRYSLAASILHAAGQSWQPRRGAFLSHAYLSGVQWAEARLRGAILFRARLNAADLSYADLKGASLCECNLLRANLNGASLTSANLRSATLVGANLANVKAKRADFRGADLSTANLVQGTFVKAKFLRANLKGARFHGADLSHATFRDATIDEADFTDACLRHADLQELPLRGTVLSGACLEGARLQRCDLEFMALPHVDFSGADLTNSWLTGTVMPEASFRGAVLRGAGLADVEWEGVDLRDADLRDCMFHMGSSRSGLVGSPYPGHGSRTGFYTDAYDDRYYKSPEEIRKANLRGADLRGAHVDNVDFYLVDLRDAKYDRRQADHFRRCDAILESS